MVKDKSKNFITEDDKLWNSITKNTKKYKASNRIVAQVEPSRKKIILKKEEAVKENKKKVFDKIKTNNRINIKADDKNNTEDLNPSKIPSGISLNQAHNFKRGKLRPEKTYDLHGYTQYRAHSYLSEEILKCYRKNIRILLIITGKKLGASGAEGVLKKEVPRWLNLSPLREIILMTSWATPRDGGDGALYVLLKRFKK